MPRHIFFISDGTGITAETVGMSLLTQFELYDFEYSTLPYIDTPEKAQVALSQITEAYQRDGEKPIVFSSLMNKEVYNIIAQCPAIIIDAFAHFIPQLEEALGMQASGQAGKSHSVKSPDQYHARIDAVNFTITTDDGLHPDYYKKAEIILVGVSRSGKTPTSIYLALNFGIKCANYPITQDDLEYDDIPRVLKEYTNKCFGLTIDPGRLNQIRTQRRADSTYATLKQCEKEVRAAEAIFRQHKIPMINTTQLSVEEIATRIIAEKGLHRGPR
jgi:hypothetical protein